jgi:flavin reductase (DIM6/NTAB) family NADH-FMN oxidoreductase RutF
MKKSLGANTIAYPTPAWAVATYDSEGQPNVMTAAWGGICCSKPPAVSVSLRKATYTFGNIEARRAFTVNVASAAQVEAVDYFGIVSGRDTDKLADAGLTPVRSKLVDAPYIEEFPLVLECKLIHTIEIGLHTAFIGEILDVKIDEELLGEKRSVDVARLNPLIFAPKQSTYYRLGDQVGQAFSIGQALKKDS